MALTYIPVGEFHQIQPDRDKDVGFAREGRRDLNADVKYDTHFMLHCILDDLLDAGQPRDLLGNDSS